MYFIFLKDSDIDEVIVTNTIPLDNQKLITKKIQTVDISILIAEAIRFVSKPFINKIRIMGKIRSCEFFFVSSQSFFRLILG